MAWLGSGDQGLGQLHVDGRLATVRDLLGERQVRWLGRTYRLERDLPPSVASAGRGGSRGIDESGVLTAPMPGRVLSLSVAVGDAVAAGQTLVVLEAMKMEHAIEAPHAGVVKRVDVAVHQQVARGEPLLELEEEPA